MKTKDESDGGKKKREKSLLGLYNSFIVRTYKIHWTLKQVIVI